MDDVEIEVHLTTPATSISAARASRDAVVVQQLVDTSAIEVDLTTPATNVESRGHQGTVVVVSNMQDEAGHVGLLTYQAAGKSNAEEISVEVVLDDVRPPVREAPLSSLGDGDSDLGEGPASVELVIESAEVETVEGSNTVTRNGGIEQSSQAGNAGYSLEVEAVVVSDANNTVNSTATQVVDERGTVGFGAGADEVGTMELDVSSNAGLEQKDEDVVMSDSGAGIIVILEKDSAADLRFVEEVEAIEEPQLMINSEGEIAIATVDNVAQLGTGHPPAEAMRITIEEALPTAISEETENATHHSIVDLNECDEPESETLEAIMTFDIPTIAEELNGRDSSATTMMEGGLSAAEIDSASLIIIPASPNTCAEEHLTLREWGGIDEIASIPTMDELTEANLGTSAVGDAGEELVLSGENVGVQDIREVMDISMATSPGERQQLSNSDQVTINEASCLHVVETTVKLGPNQETNVAVRLDEVKTTSLETTTDILIQIPDDRIEDPPKSNSMTETAPDQTSIQTPLETTEEYPGVKNSEERTFQEMIPKVTNEAGVPLGKTMNTVINPDDTTVFEKGEGTETVNPPAVMQEEREVVAITESGATTDDDLIDPEGCLFALEATIGNHGVLIGVGSSVESSGLTITEIAGSTVMVEEFQMEQHRLWNLSAPLITPPEEEIIEALGDQRAPLDDIAAADEPPKSTPEGLVLEVTEDDARVASNDSQSSSDGEIPNPSGTTASTQTSNKHAAQSAECVARRVTGEQITSEAVAVDTAEPLDLPDEQLLLPAPRDMEVAIADFAAARVLSPPLRTPPTKNIRATDVVAESPPAQGRQDEILAIAEAVDLPMEVPVEEQGVSLPNDVVRSEAHFVETTLEDGSSFTLAFESRLDSISMASCNEEMLSSIHETATAVVEQVNRVEQENNIDVDASDVVAPISNELGFYLESAGVESAVVEADIDGRGNEQVEECVLDGSAYVVVDGLKAVEALERNERKRARENEGDGVAEDPENIPKSAKTSNGEISLLNDVHTNDAKIEEDVQVDKKRSRDALEVVSGNPEVSIQVKVQKTGIGDANPVSQSGNADTEEANAEECVDMEDKEESLDKSVNGAGQDSTAPRYKKRKIALFLGYSGAGYQGMQKNPGAITIEGELEDALFRAGAIAESNYGQPQKLDWRRAARTDKGVSAVGQVVSGTFFIDPPGFIERVNSHLPKQIRVYGFKRATASFNAKKLCDRRKYEYVLPVYAFDPTVHLDRETAQAVFVDETNSKATTTKVSGPAVEREATVVTESEMKGTMVEEEITGTILEPAGETVMGLLGVATNTGIPKIEGNEGNGMSAVTDELTSVREIAHENVAVMETLVETRVDPSPENKEDTNGMTSIAPVEVLVQTKEFSVERTEVTVSDTVADLSDEEKKEALDEKVKTSTYKFDEAEFNRLSKILSGFEGHHNFHNFTARTKATDPSANRYIISFGVEDTFTINGIQFVRCSVVGQSFMLHQIRKMIGLAVAIMRGTAPESILATALRRDTKINVPMAPELGLFLEECYYSAYNKRFKATHVEMSLSSFSAEVNQFKKEFIYPHIGSTEAKNSTFAMWLHSLNDRHYPDFVAAREAEKLIDSQ